MIKKLLVALAIVVGFAVTTPDANAWGRRGFYRPYYGGAYYGSYYRPYYGGMGYYGGPGYYGNYGNYGGFYGPGVGLGVGIY